MKPKTIVLTPNIIKGNCLLNAIKHYFMYFPYGKIGYDFSSPAGRISFFCEVKGKRFRFRRKLRVHGNKSRIWFEGYVYEEKLPVCEDKNLKSA